MNDWSTRLPGMDVADMGKNAQVLAKLVDGVYRVIGVYPWDQVEAARREHEAQDDGRYRTYSLRTEVHETSRTIRDGEVRFHVVEREITDTRFNETLVYTKWWVLPVSQDEPSRHSDGRYNDWGTLPKEIAEKVCELSNKLPEGFSASYKPERHGRSGPIASAMFEVSCTIPGDPCDGGNRTRWSAEETERWMDRLPDKAEAHLAGLDERKKQKAQAEAAAARAEKRREEIAEWERVHGPRATPDQKSAIANLWDELAEVGGSDRIEGPRTKAEMGELTKADATVLINNMIKLVEQLRRQRAEEKYKIREDAQ